MYLYFIPILLYVFISVKCMCVLGYKFTSPSYIFSHDKHNTIWRAKMGERFCRAFCGKKTVVWQVSCVRTLGWWGMSMQVAQSYWVILSSAIPSLCSLTDEYARYLTVPVPTQFHCSVAASTGSYAPCALYWFGCLWETIFTAGLVRYTQFIARWNRLFMPLQRRLLHSGLCMLKLFLHFICGNWNKFYIEQITPTLFHFLPFLLRTSCSPKFLLVIFSQHYSRAIVQ